MSSSRYLRAGAAGAILATVITGHLGSPSAVAATVANRTGAAAPSDEGVLGDDAGPVPAVAVATPAARSADAAAKGLRAVAGRQEVAPVVTLTPTPSVALPAQLDVQPSYSAQTSCDPFAKPGATAFGDLMLATYHTGSYGISRLCHLDGTSEHKDGRAIDWMLSVDDPAQKAVADAALAWLTADNGANARRLGVMYLIWNRQMWRAYAPERGWQPYTGSSPHTDHIHTSLTWDGAMKRTSWWTGSAATSYDLGPCRVYAGQYAPLYTGPRYQSCPTALPAPPATTFPVYVYGQSAPDIAVAQGLIGVSADGAFGSATRQALLTWQSSQGLPRTGVLDNASWARLAPPAPPAQAPAPQPAPAPAAPVAPNPVPRSAPAPGPVASPPAQPVTPRQSLPSTVQTAVSGYKSVRLSLGSRGAAVSALQRALKVRSESRFGAATKAAVEAVQRSARLRVTGVTDTKTWNRIEERAYPWVGYRNVVLAQGSTGAAVVALQRALKLTADGEFGPVTAAAVRSVQARFGLAQDGTTSLPTWLAIIALAST